MKTTMKFCMALLLISITSLSARGQNWTNVEPKGKKMLIDTTLLTAMEVTIAPGETTIEHTHPAHFLYALADCNLKIKYSDGKTENLKMKQGESRFGNPERPHRTTNAGKTPAKFLLVELKEHPYSAKK